MLVTILNTLDIWPTLRPSLDNVGGCSLGPMNAQPLIVESVEISGFRLREGGFWLGLLLLVLLVTASVAETQGDHPIAIDGVSLGHQRAAVESRLGPAKGQRQVSDGQDKGATWVRYAACETTVTFSPQGECVRVKGSRLTLGQKRGPGLGDTRGDVVKALGEPIKAGTFKGREVLEFETADRTALTLVLEDGLLVQLSAARAQRG